MDRKPFSYMDSENRLDSQVSQPLIHTKLFAPLPRSNLVLRPRLITQLRQSAQYPLTLICAPAGYGKTTLLAEWIHVINHNPARFAKDLQPVRGPGSEVLLVYENTAGEEASAVVQMLEELYRSGRIDHWRDVAILLRSVKSHAGPYRDALTLAGIPF